MASEAEIDRICADVLTVTDLPPSALDRLLNALRRGDDLDAFTMPDLLGVPEQGVEPLLRLLSNRLIGREQTHVLLEAITAIKKQTVSSREDIELCWTGPPSLDVMAKSTASVIQELLGRAKREILIVGYRLTDKKVGAALADAIGHVNNMVLIIDNDKQRANLAIINDMFKGTARPRIYAHKTTERGFYKVHAKVIIIDECEMLLTSANMTHHGIRRNFEMGLRVNGHTATEARSLIMQMVRNNYFEEV